MVFVLFGGVLGVFGLVGSTLGVSNIVVFV